MPTLFTSQSPTGILRWQLLSLALAMLLPSLGTSIANVALPTLQTAFATSFGQVQWVVLSYLLAVTALIVVVGRLGDLIGRRRLLLAGIAAFSLSSGLAAVAPTLGVLIAARAAQGLGAAVMMALAVATANDVVSKERTGSAMGLLGTVSAVGTALGPTLGGALLSRGSWPTVFAVLAGAGAATFVIAFQTLPRDPARDHRHVVFDVAGSLLLVLSLAAYALSMTIGGTNPGLVAAGFAALAVAGIAAFVFVERRVASPLIQIDQLRQKGLRSGLIGLGLVSTIVMATLVVGPFYLTGTLHLTPIQTGLVMSIGPGVAALAGAPAGWLVDRSGSSRAVIVGLAVVAAGAVLMTFLPSWLGVSGYAAALVVITAGYALFQAANTTAVMTGAPSDRKGLRSALLGLARNLGLITGAAAMGSVFALGSGGLAFLGLPAGRETGLSFTFAVAAFLAGIALFMNLRNTRPK